MYSVVNLGLTPENYELRDEGFISLLHNLRYLTKLEKLDVVDCRITTNIAETLKENLKYVRKLRELLLGCNNIIK